MAVASIVSAAIAQPKPPDVKARFTVATKIDLREVQVALQNTLNGIRKVDRCGENFNVWDARLLPNGTSVKPDFQARFLLNKCAIITVPEWHGLWRMEWHDRVVGETILVSQAGHIATDLTPVIQNGQVTFEANVVTADMNGLLGRLKLNGQVKALLNGKIRDAIREHLKVALPPEMQKADVKITELTFFDEGGGALAAHIKATGILAPSF